MIGQQTKSESQNIFHGENVFLPQQQIEIKQKPRKNNTKNQFIRVVYKKTSVWIGKREKYRSFVYGSSRKQANLMKDFFFFLDELQKDGLIEAFLYDETQHGFKSNLCKKIEKLIQQLERRDLLIEIRALKEYKTIFLSSLDKFLEQGSPKETFKYFNNKCKQLRETLALKFWDQAGGDTNHIDRYNLDIQL